VRRVQIYLAWQYLPRACQSRPVVTQHFLAAEGSMAPACRRGAKSPAQVFQQVHNGTSLLFFEVQQAAKTMEIFDVAGHFGIAYRSTAFADPGINSPKVLAEQVDKVRALTLIRAGTRRRRMVGPDVWPRRHRPRSERNAMGRLVIVTEVGTVCADHPIGHSMCPSIIHHRGVHFVSVDWGSVLGLRGR
jgi:hypothetical protein